MGHHWPFLCLEEWQRLNLSVAERSELSPPANLCPIHKKLTNLDRAYLLCLHLALLRLQSLVRTHMKRAHLTNPFRDTYQALCTVRLAKDRVRGPPVDDNVVSTIALT